MTFRQRFRLYRLSNRYLQNQLAEWNKAHVRWSQEKRWLQDRLRRAEAKNRNQTVLVDTSKDVARIVAEHFLPPNSFTEQTTTTMRAALMNVIRALDGERDPRQLGIDPGDDDGIKIIGLTDQDPNPIQTFSRYPETR